MNDTSAPLPGSLTGPLTEPVCASASAAPSFDTLGLPPALQATLRQLDYLTMTPIQAASLPLALAGRDLLAQARTGSGKTAAFALPLLLRLDPRRFEVQALVLCPTRELAEQVTQEIRRLARFENNLKVLSLCGGSTLRPQRASLEHGAHVVVGTPGRILDHLARGSLRLGALNTLVLDEADRMLDMGFHDDIADIAERCPQPRQTLLFSATYPAGVLALARRFLHEAAEVKLTEAHPAERIRERFHPVRPEARLQAVAALLKHYRPLSALAFCNTRQQCRDLVEVLRAQGFHALTLNGELEQRERDQVLIRFANRSCTVLVATDVAARGLDIAGLEAVINVDIAHDPETHIHRIGRTGRGEDTGWALSLCGPAERRRVEAIAQVMGRDPEWHELDELQDSTDAVPEPPMVTLLILGGRKDKIRPGDVLGVLTAAGGCSREQVGRITVTDHNSYVAVRRDIVRSALRGLAAGRLKGKPLKVRALDD
jgi:ATP-independent RNA helicase DbpA